MTEEVWYDRMGRLLRQARKRRGWTIYDVATIAGVSFAAVSRWERGIDRMRAYPYHLLREEGLLP